MFVSAVPSGRFALSRCGRGPIGCFAAGNDPWELSPIVLEFLVTGSEFTASAARLAESGFSETVVIFESIWEAS